MDPPTTKLYRPSNSSEATAFLAKHCDRCANNKFDECEILTRALLEEPVPEWYSTQNGPTCSGYKAGRTFNDTPNFETRKI